MPNMRQTALAIFPTVVQSDHRSPQQMAEREGLPVSKKIYLLNIPIWVLQ